MSDKVSAQVKWTVTGALYQPLALALVSAAAVMVGLVLSIFTVTTLLGSLWLPARSVTVCAADGGRGGADRLVGGAGRGEAGAALVGAVVVHDHVPVGPRAGGVGQAVARQRRAGRDARRGRVHGPGEAGGAGVEVGGGVLC